MGTWQFGGQFKKLTISEIEFLVSYAISCGVRHFDTAAVYGGGTVEEILGSCLPKDTFVLTKIPANPKPSLSSPGPINAFYCRDGILRSVSESLNRLRRDSVDVLLLHNWLPNWSSDAIWALEILFDLKAQGVAKKVGISLPDNFSVPISEEILPYLDVLEAPFNYEETWICRQLSLFLDLKIEIILRSIFKQGKLLREKQTADEIIRRILKFGTSLAIGMTTEQQINRNVKTMKGGSL